MIEEDENNNKEQTGQIHRGPVCGVSGLDSPLPEPLKTEFRNLFYGSDGAGKNPSAWRLFYRGRDPERYFMDRFHISLSRPTIRDAVALDLVKLDDDYASNDYVYTSAEHVNYSVYEYERFLLHRNFRVNLVNLEPEWSDIRHRNDEEGKDRKHVRTVDRVYQGVRLSKTLMGWFKEILDSDGQRDLKDIYIPFTNANDFTTEVSLIPNTHPDFNPVTSRAYYDMKYRRYLRTLRKYGINAVSSFALVDPERDKNHIGQYLVKVQRKLADGYQYVVARIDKDGQIARREEDGSPDAATFKSPQNTILCVCRDDFCRFDDNGFITAEDRPSDREDGDSLSLDSEIPMVKSTTSSHYSIFRQRIPDYDLKYVRNYLQFKNRLQGMELCLEQLRRDVNRKEVQSSECFNKETIYIWKLFQELTKNKSKMELVKRYYDLLAEHDELVVRLKRMNQSIDGKKEILANLLAEYNSLNHTQLNRKLSVGQKIKSVRLELDKTFSGQVEWISQRRKQIRQEIQQIVDELGKTDEQQPVIRWDDTAKGRISAAMSEIWKKVQARRPKKDGQEEDDEDERSPESDQVIEQVSSHVQDVLDKFHDHFATSEDEETPSDDGEEDEELPQPELIDTRMLERYVRLSERWRGYMFNLGYELKQMRQMLTMCEDATIKVRRLVHNFKERMEDVERQVWDGNHCLREGFDFKSVSGPGIRDIILLHDWYAANAPEVTFKDMGFKDDDEFMEFRKSCNRISFNLRKNQYAEMLAIRRSRLENKVNELKVKSADSGNLKYNDKYGWEAKKEQDAALEDNKWSLEDSMKEKVKGTGSGDSERTEVEMKTLRFLKSLGLIDDEDDLERLVLRGKAVRRQSDSAVVDKVSELERIKKGLDGAKDNLMKYRQSLQSLLDSVYGMEKKMKELENENTRIFNACFTMKDRTARNSLLLRKLDNESRIQDIRKQVKDVRKRHLDDLSRLEEMRADVDRLQREYNNAVSDFRDSLGGVTSEDISNLLVGVYNRFQNEIPGEGGRGN